MPFSRFPHYLLSIFPMALFSFSSAAQINEDNFKTCPIPTYKRIELPDIEKPDGAVLITANKTVLKRNNFALFSGGVTLSGNGQNVKADHLEVNQETSTFNASGDIHFQSNAFDVFASDLSSSEITQATSLLDTSYQLSNNPGHGAAGEILIHKDGILQLLDASFTTCYGETPAWQLDASEIYISAEENLGEAYHAKFKLAGIPVLYIPYINFPVTDQRKSGFLYPSISSSSKHGAEILTPFYWNIAENMDATITPRYMSKRGTQLITEFRYLTGDQFGQVDIEYLNKDNELNSDDDRYLARIQHYGTFSNNFRAHVDTTTISDDAYLVDLGTKHFSDNDAYIYQVGELSYFQDTWNVTAKLQDFEILGDYQNSYKTLPQIELNSKTPLDFLNSYFDVYSELTAFSNADKTEPEAERYHVEAGLVLPYTTPGWFINSELKLLHTHYNQKNTEKYSQLEENVDRTLPKFRLHGGVTFDRDMLLDGYTQTLEPQLQYLYIPNKDQTGIYVYDSAQLQDDYDGLFRDKRFSGLDRIAEANQYSWGVTSRILNPNKDEVFRFSLGRIVYLNDSNFETVQGSDERVDESALAAETFFRIDKNWQLSADIQYNTDANLTNKSQFTVDYKPDEKFNSQLNHRYTRNVSGFTLEQLSFLSTVRLNEDWKAVGRITQDLQLNRSIESYVGLQYESCCWAVRFAYHRHINSIIDDGINSNDERDEFDSGFMIKFVFKGLNGLDTSLDINEMLNSSIFGYKRPYFLNN